MQLSKWFWTFWKRLSLGLCSIANMFMNLPWTPSIYVYQGKKKTKEKLEENLRKKMYCTENCDLHHILREKNKISWPARQLKVNESHRIIEITERFYKNLKTWELSTETADYIRIIEETFLQFVPVDTKPWKRVRKAFEEARQKNSPELVIRAYTREQDFTKCLNNHLAANSYHFLQLFCTIQNCPILNRTQEYTEAFSVILTHPDLNDYVVKNKTLYRGEIQDDRTLIDSYQVGDTILTTALVSTSLNISVAHMYCDPDPNKKSVPILWIYSIHDGDRRTALHVETLSEKPYEEEVLILRYAPFKITSINTDDNGKTNIHLNQCSEHVTESN